jgi:uncharacterized protein (TIGR02217 family)
MQGQNAPFWLSPPGEAEALGQLLGIGDGATTDFQLVRSFGIYSEPVAGTSGVSAVYVNGLPASPADYSVTEGFAPTIIFANPPASGATITADFSLLWLCRFSEDVLDFEEFMAMLFELGVVKLQTVSP